MGNVHALYVYPVDYFDVCRLNDKNLELLVLVICLVKLTLVITLNYVTRFTNIFILVVKNC